MHIRLICAAVVVGLAITGCAAEGGDASGDELAGTRWELVEVAGMPAAGEAWIAFEPGGRAGGRSGCNHFGGDYEFERGALSFGQIASTKMACPGAPMEVETRFHAALEATAAAEVADGRLLLLDEDGTVLATFARSAGE